MGWFPFSTALSIEFAIWSNWSRSVAVSFGGGANSRIVCLLEIVRNMM